MRFLLVYLDLAPERGYVGCYQRGVASLLAVARAAGHEVALAHLTNPGTAAAQLAEKLRATAPGCVGWSFTTNMLGWFHSLLPVARRACPDARQIAGGTHPTLSPETVLAAGLDAVVAGEGELVLPPLLAAFAAGTALPARPGVWQAGEKPPTAPELVTELDRLPFPDRKLFHPPGREATVMASRGCPFSCRYCCNHALRAVAADPRHYVRFHSVDYVLAEIAALRKLYPEVTSLKFNDDVLPLRPEWFAEFSVRYRREVALPFTCNLHPKLVSPDTVRMLREAGCTRVQIGVESGSERVRRELLGRAISDSELQTAVELLQVAGLRVQTFNIIGFPGETIDEMWQTAQFNATLRPELAQCTIFYPYPGTALHDDCAALLRPAAGRLTSYDRDTPLAADFRRRTVVRFIRHYFKFLILPRARAAAALCQWLSHTAVGALPLYAAVLLYEARRRLHRHRRLATASP